jgi:hypothetical protein
LSDQKAKEHRAKQTVNNLLLSLLVCVGLVVVLILIVPRDDSSRIAHIDYKSVAQQASEASKHEVLAPELPSGWWSNKATWLSTPVDAVPRFEVGFVGPKNQYIGMTQAFGVNPTWIALTLKDVVIQKNYQNSGSTIQWSIYKSPEVHTPAKTRDIIWIANIDQDAVLLYGDGTAAEFTAFTKAIEKQLGAK